jgi:large subunit ribosomal protein L22
MGKDKTPRKLETNQARAVAKFVRVPPRKARLVMDAVRGKYVSDALALLKFVPNFAAEAISDVIKSAAANAENGRPYDPDTEKPLPALDTDNLKVVQCFVDEGPRIKRIQPRAQGRAYRIVKRMCHITVIVEEAAPKPRPPRRPQAGRRARPQAARPAAPTRPAAVTPAPAAPTPTPPPTTGEGLEEKTAMAEEAAATVEETAPAAEAAAPAEETAAEGETIETPAASADNAEDAPADAKPEAE